MSAVSRQGSAAQVLLACGGLVLVLAGVEIGVRLLSPTPRAQAIQSDSRVELTISDGVPVWRNRRDPRARPDRACMSEAPRATHVVGVGSSILYGVKIAPDNTWAPQTRALLDAQGMQTCVHNLAAPGFGALQKRQLLREFSPELAPKVILWELWGTDVLHYRVLGDMAWRLGDLVVGPDGYPNPLGLPLPVNQQLFDHSAAWRFATVAVTPEGEHPEGDWEEVLHGPLSEALDLAEANGGSLLLAAMPPLDRAFAVTADNHNRMVERTREWMADQAGRPVRLVRVAELLRDDDVEALRLDTCCHFNEAGHTRLAEVLAPELALDLRR